MNEEQIVSDLKDNVYRMMNDTRSWSGWKLKIENRISELENENLENQINIEQEGTILPNELFNTLPTNIQTICKQINASYEQNLFDCTAVMMRRLLESLLVLSYQKFEIESEIMNENHHLTLDKIIKKAEQNKILKLSSNTKKDMSLFKDLGNYSAHRIWYNTTKGDIKPHILKYRVIIEELLYKSGLK